MDRKCNKADLVFLFLLMMVVCFGIGTAVGDSYRYEDVKELGSAICEEEYDISFSYYSTSDGLKCKDIKDIEESDVMIKEGYVDIDVTIKRE